MLMHASSRRGLVLSSTRKICFYASTRIITECYLMHFQALQNRRIYTSPLFYHPKKHSQATRREKHLAGQASGSLLEISPTRDVLVLSAVHAASLSITAVSLHCLFWMLPQRTRHFCVCYLCMRVESPQL